MASLDGMTVTIQAIDAESHEMPGVVQHFQQDSCNYAGFDPNKCDVNIGAEFKTVVKLNDAWESCHVCRERYPTTTGGRLDVFVNGKEATLGKGMKGLIMKPHQEVHLETFIESGRTFTYSSIDGEKGIAAGLKRGDENNGLITVVLTHEKVPSHVCKPRLERPPYSGFYSSPVPPPPSAWGCSIETYRPCMRGGGGRVTEPHSFQEGGISEGRESHQKFLLSTLGELDPSRTTTIHIRLVTLNVPKS